MAVLARDSQKVRYPTTIGFANGPPPRQAGRYKFKQRKSGSGDPNRIFKL